MFPPHFLDAAVRHVTPEFLASEWTPTHQQLDKRPLLLGQLHLQTAAAAQHETTFELRHSGKGIEPISFAHGFTAFLTVLTAKAARAAIINTAQP
jgi:hypothetical protein